MAGTSARGISEDAELSSLRRRLHWTSAWHNRVDAALSRFGTRPRGLRYLQRAPELVELLRARGRLSHRGWPNEAALAVSNRLPQPPRDRRYWYDPTTHSLVGRHLGLDLHRHQGKYYVLESNISPATRPERRALYDSDLDPFVAELVAAAKARRFERVVFHRHAWSEHYHEEFTRASEASGIEVIGASSPFDDSRAKHPLIALPHPLGANTLHVVWRVGPVTPLCHFVHDKLWSARWLRQTIEAAAAPTACLGHVPTFDHLVMPAAPTDPRWPNLVVKLSGEDGGRFVAMGRFRTEIEARRGLRLPDGDPRAIPGIFELPWRDRVFRRLFPRSETVYQPFVPPEVIGNHARKIRLHVFISPLFDAFLSAHATMGREELPGRVPPGLLRDSGSFNCNFSAGGRFARLEPAFENELRLVADEFGRMAKMAISEKFETGPPTGGSMTTTGR